MSKIIDKSKVQQKAEAEVAQFRDRRGPFVFAGESTRMAMVFTDAKEANNPIILANDSFLSLTGYDRKEKASIFLWRTVPIPGASEN